MKFSERLKQYRELRGLTQTALAKQLGISKSTVSMYEHGYREPSYELLEAIADILNVSMNELLGYGELQTSMYVKNIEPLPEFKPIPLLGSIACGEPILAEENIEYLVRADKKLAVDFALRCVGDSMINARIFNGDIVFIRQQPDVDDGDIAAVLIGNEATLKKVHKFSGKLVLSPCNPLYDDLIYTGEQLDAVRILGKAVAFISAVR